MYGGSQPGRSLTARESSALAVSLVKLMLVFVQLMKRMCGTGRRDDAEALVRRRRG